MTMRKMKFRRTRWGDDDVEKEEDHDVAEKKCLRRKPAFVQDVMQKVTVEEVKRKLSCEISLKI